MAFNDPGLGDSKNLQLATKIGVEKKWDRNGFVWCWFGGMIQMKFWKGPISVSWILFFQKNKQTLKEQRLNWKLFSKYLGKTTLLHTSLHIKVTKPQLLQCRSHPRDAFTADVFRKIVGFLLRKNCGGNTKWVFPKIRVPQNGWFIMENPIKMDDLGVPLFSETSKFTQTNCEHLPPPFWSLLAWISNLNHMDSFALLGFPNSGATKNLIDWAPA